VPAFEHATRQPDDGSFKIACSRPVAAEGRLPPKVGSWQDLMLNVSGCDLLLRPNLTCISRGPEHGSSTCGRLAQRPVQPRATWSFRASRDLRYTYFADTTRPGKVERQETSMPRFMIQVRATAMSEAGDFPDDPTLVPRMMAFHDEMAQAGVLLDGAGLQPSSQGFRMQCDAAGHARVVDGPFAEAKELIAGYTLIEVRSREEALAWARRFPAPFPGQPCCIEVRPLMGGIDLPPEDAERIIREQLAAIKRGE
jgi:hypothetical protein